MEIFLNRSGTFSKDMINSKMLREAKWAKKVTHQKIADNVGISRKRVGLILNGCAGVRSKNLEKICKFLGLRIKDIDLTKKCHLPDPPEPDTMGIRGKGI